MGREISKEELKELQLKILDHVDAFCKENGIRYSLSSGTLLGAVRHRGYIPWDDDIDIMMLREDYEKFRFSYREYNQNVRYQMVDYENECNFYHIFVKIHDTSTLVNEAWQMPELGVNIDIFPIDSIPSNEIIARLLYYIIFILDNCQTCVRSSKKKRTLWKNIIAKFISFSLPPKVFCKLLNAVLISTGKFKSQAVANLVFWKYWQKRVPRTVFLETEEIMFEHRMFSAIKDYDCYLSSVYGDYMTPPVNPPHSYHNVKPTWKFNE